MQIASGAMQPKSAVVSDILNDFFEELTLKFENKSPLNGIPTGYKALDSLLSGFCRTDLIILAARPGCGKTSLALCMLLNAALNGTPTAFFSLEMGQEQIIQRLISIESGVNLKNLRSAYLDDADWMHIYNAAEKMREGQCPLYVDDSPALSPLELSARARRLKAEHDIGLIVVDYLQLMRVKEERVNSQEQEIAIISGSLKALAKELNVPIIALSQLNRQLEQRALNDRRPKLSDLRYSGAIEQDADVIMFIYREELYSNDISKENIAEVIVAKHRNGPCGAVELFFKKECTRFLNLRQDEEM
jgi:replicative DNA helicase